MQFSEVIELGNTDRTEDVRSSGSFQSLMISPAILTKLASAGFKYPSPVQEKAIPAALTGLDLLVQAKSGTGKTLVFSVMAVENLNISRTWPQRLLVAPTREIAIQIRDTIKRLQPSGCRTNVLVGGTPLPLDRQALKKGSHIIVGTTGRVCQMIQEGTLKLDYVELFVLDEADKLMDDDFQRDINYIFSCLPATRQVAVFSATYPKGLDEVLGKYMKDGTLVRLNADDVQLVGIMQYVSIVLGTTAVVALENILNSVGFSQALIFCNTYPEAEFIYSYLTNAGFEVGYISAKMEQNDREKIILRLKSGNLKILVSTDLTARGVDASNVNLVVNIRNANDTETYFHRIGRAARFGGQGAAITLLEDSRAVTAFSSLVSKGGINVKLLDLNEVPFDLTSNKSHHDSCMSFMAKKKIRPVAKVKPATKFPEVVPIQIFKDIVPNDSVEGSSYDRDEMLQIGNYLPPISDEFAQRIVDLDVGKKDFAADLNLLAADIKARKTAPLPENNEVKEEIKYKFVPSREKAKKKFYMRGELLAIKDSIPKDEWLRYAQSKYNLTEDPFIFADVQECCDKLDNLTLNSPSLTVENIQAENSPQQQIEAQSVSSREDTNDNEEIKEKNNDNESPKGLKFPLRIPQFAYTSEQMFSIQKSKSEQQWRTYVMEKYNTKEDPFVMDPSMRCSVSQQLRNQREKERLERIKVMKQREDANKMDKFYSSSRSFRTLEVTARSWDDYFTQVYNEFQLFQESNSEKEGAVVPIRDSPAIWHERVLFYSTAVDNIEANFYKDTRISGGFLIDNETNTEGVLPLEINLTVKQDPNTEINVENEDCFREQKHGDYKHKELKEIDENVCNVDVDKKASETTSLDNTVRNKSNESGNNLHMNIHNRSRRFFRAYNQYFKLMREYCNS